MATIQGATMWARLTFATGVMTMAGAAVCASAATGSQYFGLAGGGGEIMHAAPCADIPCNQGDTCSCITSTGSATFEKASGAAAHSATYTLELSADDTTHMHNGGMGNCFGTSGYIVLKLDAGTLTLPIAGLACRMGSASVFGITAPTYIASSTGKFQNPTGTGSFSGTFNDAAKSALINIVAYAIFPRA